MRRPDNFITEMGENTVACPDCGAPGTATVRVSGRFTIGYFFCGSNTQDKHRTPGCYEHELSRETLRRTDALDYLREACGRHGGSEAGDESETPSVAMQELVNVTNILCAGKALYPDPQPE